MLKKNRWILHVNNNDKKYRIQLAVLYWRSYFDKTTLFYFALAFIVLLKLRCKPTR